MRWLIYGAGYTGSLLASVAARRGERPVVAGRDPAALRVARRHGVEARVAEVHDLDLSDIDVVVNCAGPFLATAQPLVAACLRTGTHYLDVAGEVEVLESIYARHAEAVRAGIVLVPGLGVDVVLSDHLAAALLDRLPTATQLDIALITRGGATAGSLKSMLHGIRGGGVERVNGTLVAAPLCARTRTIPTTFGPTTVASVPLGDLASAYRTTGIPNITTYGLVPFGAVARYGDGGARRALRAPFVTGVLGGVIDRVVAGPSDVTRASTTSEVWVHAGDDCGTTVSGSEVVGNAYDFTVAAVLAALDCLRTNAAPGAWAPRQAFSTEFWSLCTDSGAKISR